MKTKLLSIPAALAVVALANAGCPEPTEPESHEHEVCFCEVPPGDAGPELDAGLADSGCMAPSERTCVTV